MALPSLSGLCARCLQPKTDTAYESWDSMMEALGIDKNDKSHERWFEETKEGEMVAMTCAICFQPVSERAPSEYDDRIGNGLGLVQLTCGDVFHRRCIRHWLVRKSDRPSCPLCRAEIVSADIRDIVGSRGPGTDLPSIRLPTHAELETWMGWIGMIDPFENFSSAEAARRVFDAAPLRIPGARRIWIMELLRNSPTAGEIVQRYDERDQLDVMTYIRHTKTLLKNEQILFEARREMEAFLRDDWNRPFDGTMRRQLRAVLVARGVAVRTDRAALERVRDGLSRIFRHDQKGRVLRLSWLRDSHRFIHEYYTHSHLVDLARERPSLSPEERLRVATKMAENDMDEKLLTNLRDEALPFVRVQKMNLDLLPDTLFRVDADRVWDLLGGNALPSATPPPAPLPDDSSDDSSDEEDTPPPRTPWAVLQESSSSSGDERVLPRPALERERADGSSS